MLNLDTELDAVNPGQHRQHTATSCVTLTAYIHSSEGACTMLRNEGVDPLDVAYKLSSVLPKIISIKFDSSGSANNINAALLDIVAAVQSAKAVPIAKTREQWLKSRTGAPDVIVAERQHGDAADGSSAPSDAQQAADEMPPELAPIPLAVPGT